MRHLLPVLLLGVFALPLGATETLFKVTPQALGGWSVQGIDKMTLARAKMLNLPAGAQLSREFVGGAVILRLTTRPVFSETAANWPILNVGPAALALIRKEGQGRLVLVVDEATAEVLPWTIPLTGKDALVDLVVAYDPFSGAGLVVLRDQMQAFDAAPSTQPVEVWLSAGAKSDWPQDLMEVLVLTGDENDSAKRSALDTASVRLKPTERIKAALDQLLNPASSRAGADGQVKGPIVGASPTESISTLEVFTPPSVRRAKVVEVVRATVVRKQSK